MDEDRTKRPGYGRYGDWEWDDDHPLVHPHDLTDVAFADPPPPDTRDGHDPRGGYRRASDDVWAAARQDYLNGEAVNLVCARHGLARSTFYARGRDEGWLNQERGAPEPVDLEAETAAGLPDYGDMARHALVRLNRAIEAGRGSEAAVWMRLHQRLLALADSGRDPAADTPSPPPPRPKPVAKPVDPLDLAMEQARLAGTLARSADGLMTLGDSGRRLIEKGMETLASLSSVSTSDGSDISDTVFSNAPDSAQATPQDPP
jgi:hypothetical protein